MTPRTAVATLAVVAALFAALWFGIRGIGGEGGGEAPGPQVVSPHFGYNDYWPTLGVGPGADDDPFQLVADEGGDTIRYVVDWNAAQHYDEAGRLGAVAFPLAVTAAYERAVAHGIHPILVVVGAPLNERPNAPGAQPPVGTSCTKGSETAFQIVRDTPYALARWRAFVQSVANAYPEALGIEVWNEENYPPWWGGCLPAENGNHGPGTDPYVPHYVDVLKYAYDGVKGSRHPDIPIVMGGTATRGGDPNKLDWARFLTAVLKRTQSRYGSPLVDAVALHPYRNPEDPGTGPSLSQRFATSATDQVAEARGILRREGAGDIPIWVTEISASTSAPTHSLFAAASADATARRLQIDQADALDAIYVGLRDIGVPVIIVHSFADQQVEGRDRRGRRDGRQPASVSRAGSVTSRSSRATTGRRSWRPTAAATSPRPSARASPSWAARSSRSRRRGGDRLPSRTRLATDRRRGPRSEAGPQDRRR